MRRRLSAVLDDLAATVRGWACRHPRLVIDNGTVRCGTCPAKWRR